MLSPYLLRVYITNLINSVIGSILVLKLDAILLEFVSTYEPMRMT